MANSVLLPGPQGDQINLDLVRCFTHNAGQGTVILYFDLSHARELKGDDAKKFMDEVNQLWQGKRKAA